MHIFSIANVLSRAGVDCAVCVPNDPRTIERHGVAHFQVIPYTDAYRSGVRFPDGAGPDLIHAWTPRELVRKLTEFLAQLYDCPYLVHLEDNEEAILEAESKGLTFAELQALPSEALDPLIPEHRSHPHRYKQFVAGAAAVTALMDRLLEFKPRTLPGLVFWPGFDPAFQDPQPPSAELLGRVNLHPGERILVYNGNVHDANAAEVRSLYLAVQALRRSGVPIRLLKSGWNYVEDKRWIEQAINSGAVTDLGFLDRADVPSLFTLADALVQPGKPDRFNDYRFPSKLPEFLVSGKPVVLPRSNIGRFLQPDIDAVLLEYGDAFEIASQIDRVLRQPELARKIGAAGRSFALKRLDWQKNAAPLREFYERVIGADVEDLTLEASIPRPPKVKLVAFFLPQFHPIAENDEFWGKGFTEWTNVTQARPNFQGHYQPQLPADLGFYDLRVPEVLQEQANLARHFGIYGFCFYYYWFSGRKVLEKPLDQFLRSGNPDFPFCICWANENWTRSWDGSESEILIAQDYSPDVCERFVSDVIPILKDPRYIRVSEAPLLLVYRINLLPDPLSTTRKWRQICAENGLPSIHLCAVQSFGISDPRPYGCDAAIEFPPHTKRALVDPQTFPGIRPDFEGYLEDYRAIARNQASLPWPDYVWYRGVMPAWDNTPRRGTNAHILINSDAREYEEWLRTVAEQTLEHQSTQDPILFVNAWNEWAEGAYLEPDRKYKYARLKATRRALVQAEENYEKADSSGTDSSYDAQLSTTSNTNGTHRNSIEHLISNYRDYPIRPLSYGTVKDYCDSFEHLHTLATANGDLKDNQRPWIVKALLARLPPPASLLEIGAGEPLVAHLLSCLGYEVCVADPYDGSGNGPTDYDRFRAQYPHLRFLRSQFHDRLEGLTDHQFDGIYSISVLEHVPNTNFPELFSGIRRFLKPDGVSIHAIDHVHRGNGASEHLSNLRLLAHGFGFADTDLDRLFEEMNADTETYYLSAESHNRWRAGMPYEEFPMRTCVSIQIAAPAIQIRIPAIVSTAVAR